MADNRFMRTEAMLGAENMQKIFNSTILIAGLGAVGGHVLEALARAGTGKLILVDFDRFETSNINRQILALESTIGRAKTEVAAERVHEINPRCRVVVKNMFIDAANIDELLAEKPDFAVDAIDSLGAKCLLIKELSQRGIPFISSMGAALKRETSLIKYGPLSETKNCSLARQVRRGLKKEGIDLNRVMCVSSTEPPDNRAVSDNTEGGRYILGSLPTVTAVFGLTIANEVLKRLIK